VDRELLEHVLDKTSDRAKRPFYHLLMLSISASPELLERHARAASYAELWNEPDRFRGELVRLDGYVRGLHPWQATENEFFNPAGIETLHDGYLFTDDSRPNAFVIVVPRVADGMPTGGNISERVTFVGYFFKLWRYKAADGTDRAAPLLVGQMTSWNPSPQPQQFAQLSGYLAAAFLLLILAIGGAIRLINRRGVVAETKGLPNDGAILAGLAELEHVAPREWVEGENPRPDSSGAGN
jgi:hypothetical protein